MRPSLYSGKTFLTENTHGEIKQAWYAVKAYQYLLHQIQPSDQSIAAIYWVRYHMNKLRVCISKRSFWSYFRKYFLVGIDSMLGLQVTTWQRKRVGRSKFFVHSSCSSLIGLSSVWNSGGKFQTSALLYWCHYDSVNTARTWSEICQ